MRQTGGHLPYRAQPRHVRQFILMFARLLFGTLVLGHVLGNAGHAIDFSRFIMNRKRAITNPTHGAIGLYDAVLLLGVVLRHAVEKLLADEFTIIGVNRVYPTRRIVINTLQRAPP